MSIKVTNKKGKKVMDISDEADGQDVIYEGEKKIPLEEAMEDIEKKKADKKKKVD